MGVLVKSLTIIFDMRPIHEIWPSFVEGHESGPVTKHDLHRLGHTILCVLIEIERQLMTNTEAIQAFATATKAFQDRMDTAVTDLQADVQNLEDQIAALQASPGQITPEDQAALDGIQARAAAVADKLDALDALTPPKAPVVTPTKT